MTVSERVSRGFALLDEHKTGWYRNINLDTLDVCSIGKCPVGQVYGDWGYGVEMLGINGRAGEYGFDSVIGVSYAELTAEWKHQIEARLLKDRVAGEVDAAAEAFLGIGRDEWDALLPATHLVGLG